MENNKKQIIKNVFKFIGALVFLILSIFIFILNPIWGLILFFFGLVWILQIFFLLIKKFKQSKIYPKIKEILKKILIFLLISAIIITFFNFIAGLSATTIIIILLVLILLK